MNLSHYIDLQMDKDVHEIEFYDHTGNKLNINPDEVDLKELDKIVYIKTAMFILKNSNSL
jgi:hypothetical protein